MQASPPSQSPVIKAKDLYKCYPGFPPVLRGVNIEVQPGEMVAIMGPSGCGKSTMLHVLGMLHAPDSGSLEILGENVLALNREGTAAFRRGNMGFVMQASNLFDHSTVFENVEFPLIYENVPPQERWERVIRALDLVRLSGRVHYRSNRLSGGEQQRVAIARAMVNNPKILLADEPTGALDARTSRVVMENFRHLCHDGGVAMVMVTHDPKMAEFCDSIYTLEDGVLKCQKHDPPHLKITGPASVLEVPKPKAPGALVALHFPDAIDASILELARLLHQHRLLSRIYALSSPGFLSSANNYSLPLAIRHLPRLRHWLDLWSCLFKSTAPSAPPSAAPPGLRGRLRRLSAHANALALSKWAAEDKVVFLYACDGREAAASTSWAAEQSHLPFAFAITAYDVPSLGTDWPQRVERAQFVACPTPAVKDAILQRAPGLPQEKILICPPSPIFAVGADEGEATLPPTPGQPTEILAMGTSCGRKYMATLLTAAKMLHKRGLNFHLTILGRRPWYMRWRLFHRRMGKIVTFSGGGEDRLCESFRLGDIFVAAPPDLPGAELALPQELVDAMASSLPIVPTSISPGMGFALAGLPHCEPCGEPQQLAEALGALITKPDERKRRGESAKDAIANLLADHDTGAIIAEHMERAVNAWPN